MHDEIHEFLSRVNFWGYSTVNYFSPMIRYSAADPRNRGHDAINEVKLLIREAHKRGIEVTTRFHVLWYLFIFGGSFFTHTLSLFCRFSWMWFSITLLKGMRMVPSSHLEVLITVSIIWLLLRYNSWSCLESFLLLNIGKARIQLMNIPVYYISNFVEI